MSDCNKRHTYDAFTGHGNFDTVNYGSTWPGPWGSLNICPPAAPPSPPPSTFATKAHLQSAVAEWTANVTTASSVYGHISTWNTSRVTDMSWVFCGNQYDSRCNVRNMQFNDDVNSWDVSQVTNMAWMFRHATSFDQELNSWDVSQVTIMGGMFREATSFDQELNDWNVDRVTDMTLTFTVQSAPPRARRLSPLRTAHTAYSPRIWRAPLLFAPPPPSRPHDP